MMVDCPDPESSSEVCLWPKPISRHYESEIILLCVRWYLRYALSYRDLEEMMNERGLAIDHTTIYRWAQRYAPEWEKRSPPHLQPTNDSYRVDETFVKIKGKWYYLYRAVDSTGQTIDFMLSAKRDVRAAKRFFRKMLKATKMVTITLLRHQSLFDGKSPRSVFGFIEFRQDGPKTINYGEALAMQYIAHSMIGCLTQRKPDCGIEDMSKNILYVPDISTAEENQVSTRGILPISG